jgi:hypothetical protein
MAKIYLFVGIPFLAVAVLACIIATATIPLWAQWGKGMNDFQIDVMYLFLPLLAVGYSWLAINLVRNRESLFTTFHVASTGITIENRRYGALSLDWEDLTRATYTRRGMISLESPRLLQSLVIFNFSGGRGLAPEFAAARNLIRGAMRDRWIERG